MTGRGGDWRHSAHRRQFTRYAWPSLMGNPTLVLSVPASAVGRGMSELNEQMSSSLLWCRACVFLLPWEGRGSAGQPVAPRHTASQATSPASSFSH